VDFSSISPIVPIVWFGVALAAGGSTFLVVRRLRMRPSMSLLAAVLAAGACLALLSLFSAEAPARKASVTIEHPPNGTRVEGYRLRVEGAVHPASSLVTLLVRSESDDRWWVQDVVHPDPQSGRWLIDAYVGTSTEGVRQSFTLLALASDDGVAFNLLTARHLQRGMSLRIVPQWNRSPLHVVWRAR
jgi:hypothetical protein